MPIPPLIMNLLCWNCRGLGNPRSVRQLRKWSDHYAPDIVFVSETMINRIEVEALKSRLGFSNAFGVASVGRAGGLCIFWRAEVSFSLVSYSQHHICGDVEDGEKKWRFVGVYGWAREEEKHHTWTLLRHLCEDSVLPILLGGDFNEILCYAEKEGGVDRVRREMTNFRDTLDNLALRDLGYVGSQFTWERGRSPSTCIRERLDRFVCSGSWLDLYPSSVVEHTVRYKSDHSAIVIRPHKVRMPTGKTRRIFFETSWLLDEECEAVVRDNWTGTAGEVFPGRVASMAQSLLGWSANKFKNLGKQIEAVEKRLRRTQEQPISFSACQVCVSLEKQLDDLNAKQEAYWYLRSRVSEVRDGDKNTKYFHHKAS